MSVPIVSQAPPATLRWKRTDSVDRSGSTVAATVTGSMLVMVPPSFGALTTMLGLGTTVDRNPLVRVCRALSSTTARYCTLVPGE